MMRKPIAESPGASRLPLAGCLSAVLLCSCQSMERQPAAMPAQQAAIATAPPAFSRPPVIPSGVAPAGFHGQARSLPHGTSCPCCGPGTLPPFAFTGFTPADIDGQWRPPGIKAPWPPDEYICDGGDLNHDVDVKRDWTV